MTTTLSDQAYSLCLEIEKLPTGQQQTKCSKLAAALRSALSETGTCDAEALRLLREYHDIAASALGSEPDMPSHERVMDEYDALCDRVGEFLDKRPMTKADHEHYAKR